MKYILTSNKLQGKILFEFNSNGYIRAFEIESKDDVQEKLIKWLFSRFPVHEKAMDLPEFYKLFRIEKVYPDLSFEAFWEAYSYKVGKKDKTRKLWEALSDPDKAQALTACPKYRYYLSTKTNMEQAYAETWLRNRRFEDQY